MGNININFMRASRVSREKRTKGRQEKAELGRKRGRRGNLPVNACSSSEVEVLRKQMLSLKSCAH